MRGTMVDCQCQGVCAYHPSPDGPPQLFAAWYDSRFWVNPILLSVFFVIYALSFFLNESSLLWLKILAFGLVIGGELVDYFTTMANQGLIPEYDKRGLECPYYEANPVLPRRVSHKRMIISVPTLALLCFLPVVWFFPAAGFVLGLGSLRAGVLNLRWNRFLKADLVYHDRQLHKSRGV